MAEEGERVRLLLGQRGHFHGNAPGPGGSVGNPGSLIQGLARSRERLYKYCSHLGLEPTTEHDHPVLVLVDVKCAAGVLKSGLPRLGPPVHPPPTAYDALDVGGGAGAAHPDQLRFGVRRRHAG